MSKNRKTEHIQPAERIRERGLNWLTSDKVSPEVIGKVPYLHAVNELFGKNSSIDPTLDGQRFLFIADEPEYAEKAAMAFLNLRMQVIAQMAGTGTEEGLCVMGGADGEISHRLAQVLQSFRELENEEDVVFGEDSEEDGKSGAFLIVDGKAYAGPNESRPFSAEQAAKVIMERLCYESALSERQNVYVDGFYTPLSDELIDDMNGWKADVVIVGMPKAAGGTHARRRLTFEQEFTVIRIPSPAVNWYEHLMACSLKAEGLEKRTPEEIARLTERLMQRRGSRFREDDIFRFSQMVAERHREKEKECDRAE